MIDDAMMTIAVAGAAGRMGREVVKATSRNPGLKLVAASTVKGSAEAGKDAGLIAGTEPLGVTIGENNEALAAADAVIDFTTPETSLTIAAAVAAKGGIHISGTTGFTPQQREQLQSFGKSARIVHSGNMSLGVHVLQALVERATRLLPGFDIEILEMHHHHKQDAPSGTALMLGEAAARGRGQMLADQAMYARHGQTGPRNQGEIGFAVLRGGDVVGEHTVLLAGTGERLELTHRATSRALFAEGALTAALWAAGQQPGFYSMRDVLGGL